VQPLALPALLALPEPTVAVLEGPPSNVATPREPDTPLAMRNYVVEEGDSVRAIARQFGVTNETIIWENDLTDPDILRVGEELRILPFSGLIHEVRPGDTVASLANAYDALIGDVVSANKLADPFIIVVGQKLAIPGGYRPLPRKVVVAPADQPDTVQAPGNGDLVAAVVNVPAPRRFPILGGTPQEQFIASIAEAAVESADRTGVPASVTIAQAILESYWGSSRLAHDANNFFGIKAQTRGGTLKISYAEPTHLNTAIASGTPTGFPGTQLFASLVQFGLISKPIEVPSEPLGGSVGPPQPPSCARMSRTQQTMSRMSTVPSPLMSARLMACNSVNATFLSVSSQFLR